MADALCGPSSALEKFQKLTTADRALQQDRLVGRHVPSPSLQGFRSSSARDAGALDSEFDAFQTGRASALPADFRHATPPSAHAPPLPHARAAHAPGWAADFQRLNISAAARQPQAAHAASSWHRDFMAQQAPAVQPPALPQQVAYGGVSGYSMAAFHSAPVLRVAQEAVPAPDEAAFEQAFVRAEQEAQQHLLGVTAEQSRAQTAQALPEAVGYGRPGELDPLLIRIRETRPAVYSAIQVWSETGLGHTDEAVSYLENMAGLERSGRLVEDANEAKWVVDSLQRIVNRDAPQEVKTRAESLISAINERLMSQYPLGSKVPMSEEQIWGQLEAAGYMRTPVHEQVEEQVEQEKYEDQARGNDHDHDHDEMAATAGRLLERLADNTSEKFQNSQFLELMRRLRDRQVRVEEDKIVQVNAQANASWPTSTQQLHAQQRNNTSIPASSQIPPIDRNILDHAATDYGIPEYPQDTEQEQYGPSPITGEPILTDETSDQFRSYYTSGAYNR